MKKLGISLVTISSLLTAMITATPATAAVAVDPSCTKVITQNNSSYTGSANNEIICINADNVTVFSLAGNDKVIDYGVGNTVYLGNGTDEYDGTNASNATVDGGLGEDLITGTPGLDELYGGEGDDDVYGGAGADNIDGGNGADILGGNNGEDNISGETGDDSIDGGAGNDTLAGDAGDDSLIGGGGNDNIRGGEGNDTLNGNAGEDNIWGEVGTDTLDGSEGDDIVSGGDGTDVLEGGTGLDLCDYNNNEVKTATCIYDDAAPEISSFSWDAASYDVSRTSARATSTFTMSDEVASSSVYVVCSGNGVTAIPVDFSINWINGAWSLSSRNNKSRLVSATENFPSAPRTQTEFRVETTLVQGLTSGNYSCLAETRDRLDHVGVRQVADLAVARAGSINWDDAAPKLESFTWSESSYDVTSSAAAVSYTMEASDDSGISAMQVHCPGPYRELISDYMYRSGESWAVNNHAVSSSYGDVSLHPTFGIDTSVLRGTKPGSYKCYAWLMDIRGHQTWAPIKAPLTIVRTGSGWDDEPPALVDFSWDKALYEVGAAADLAIGTLHMTDRTGITNIIVECYGPTGQRPISTYLNKENGTWVATGMNNPRVNSVSGTDLNVTIEFQSDVTFGLIPGIQNCYVHAYDSLGQHNWNLIDKMLVSRIPPGMPGAPTALVYTPTPGNPNAGVLSWNAPDFLGQRVKNDDGTDKVLNGRFVGELFDYEIEYSRDGETWKRIDDGFSTTANLPMSNLYSASDYYFRVRANNGGNDIAYSKGADWSEVLMVRTPDPTAPSAPSELEVSNITKSGAQLHWTAPETNGGANIFNFKVETSRDGGQTWQLVKKSKDRDINSTSCNLTVAGMAPGTTYQIRVSAQNRWGYSEFLTGSLTTLDGLATAPRNLTATDVTSGTLTLTWDIPLSNGGRSITDYQIEVSGNGGTTWTKIVHDVASNSNAYDITNLTRAKRYQFRVAAITELGVGNVSSVLSVTTAATPAAAPTNLVVSGVTTGNAVLNWKLPTDNGGAPIFDYLVEVSSDDGENWQEIEHNASTSKTFKLSGLRPGNGYLVRVAAVNSAGFSEYLQGSFTTVAAAPSAPTQLEAVTTTTVGDSGTEVGASLNWTIPANNGGPNITDYKIEVANNCKTFVTVTHLESNSNGFNVTGLDAGTRYCFRVSAKNSVGFGAVSNVAEITTAGVSPSAPTGFSINPAKTSVTLGWEQAAVVGGSPVRNYVVEYSRDGGTTWNTVVKPASTSRTLVVSGLRSGTTYKFRMKSVNDVGSSDYTSELTVVTKTK
ncbi:MAG: hypothetical protein RL140_92 [Actinomycetota bacterium]|jgi:hypothetical protein